MRILKARLGGVGMILQIAGSQPGGYCLVLSGISLGIEGPGALPLPLLPNLQSWVPGIKNEPPKRNKVAERRYPGIMAPGLHQGRKETLHEVAASLGAARG